LRLKFLDAETFRSSAYTPIERTKKGKFIFLGAD